MIEILGSHGNRNERFGTTCIKISENTVIDAGNIIQGLQEDAINIDNIFLTHSHLDHIIDSAFLCDNYFSMRKKPIKIYALKQTIQMLKKHFFNWEIWPDFSTLELENSQEKALEFIEIEFDKPLIIDDIKITPIEVNHTVDCCGYLIEKENHGILFSADTFKCDRIWDILNKFLHVKTLIIDVSFPSSCENLARTSKHLTPQFLEEELKKLKRKDVKIYITHIKSNFYQEIKEELEHLGINKENILHGGEHIEFATQNIIKKKDRNEHMQKVEMLNKIGVYLSSSSDLGTLLDFMVTKAKNLTNADGGTLYLLNSKKDELDFTVVQTDSLGIHVGGNGGSIDWRSVPLYVDGKENKHMVAATCVLEDRVINIKDVYETKNFNFDGTKKFDDNTGYRSKSMLVIPLKNHEKRIIGVLQLINKTKGDKIVAFNQDDESIALSLASQVAISITNTNLVEDLERLLESFLQSIIYALRRKSSYTANHIHKMVALSKMITKAVHNDNDFYKDKNFSEDEIKQINFAALMHDIGKLSTPDYILDKATKLGGLHDRIEVVQTRAWAIKKEMEIAYLKKEISHDEFENALKKIDEDLCVLEKSNEGAEFVPDEIVKKINTIAKEPFRSQNKDFYLITQDEAKLLQIQKGTLTQEEKNIINEHAIISIEILNRLPFPHKYRNIPSIAGDHHEKINGKGYPQGLKEEEISFEARILAIADIFEALTASDRPYKKPNNLSTAMKILYQMAKENDLDKDLVKFFYKSGLYKEFAKKSLNPEQIDEVDIDFSSL